MIGTGDTIVIASPQGEAIQSSVHIAGSLRRYAPRDDDLVGELRLPRHRISLTGQSIAPLAHKAHQMISGCANWRGI